MVHRLGFQQVELLEYHSDLSSQRPKFRLLQCGKLLSTDSDFSAVRRLKTVYQADQCGLSGSGKPYDTADITLFHMDTHVVQRVDGSVFS